jgi:thiaminase/transcriptional activator TenA
MRWSEQAWHSIETVYKKILELPFLCELLEGSLPSEKFYCYLRQDAIYLSTYGKLLAVIASRLDNPAHRESFLRFSIDTITVELALHATYLKEAPYSPDQGPSPVTTLYTGYLSTQILCNPIEVALAAALPCFWIYQKVGEHLVSQQNKSLNPYKAWIDTYSGEDFARSVENAIRICDGAAEKSTKKEAMTQAFQYASKMEWMFWNSAYHMETWPV